MSQQIKIIALTGRSCIGKTTLAIPLAKHLNGNIYNPEYPLNEKAFDEWLNTVFKTVSWCGTCGPMPVRNRNVPVIIDSIDSKEEADIINKYGGEIWFITTNTTSWKPNFEVTKTIVNKLISPEELLKSAIN